MPIEYLNIDIWCFLLAYPSPKPSTGDELSTEEDETLEVQNCAESVIVSLLTVILILSGGETLGLFYCCVKPLIHKK